MTRPAPGRLVDCTVCDGRGVMTSRSSDHLTGPSVVVACPVCEGRGGFVEIPLHANTEQAHQ